MLAVLTLKVIGRVTNPFAVAFLQLLHAQYPD